MGMQKEFFDKWVCQKNETRKYIVMKQMMKIKYEQHKMYKDKIKNKKSKTEKN